MLKTLIKKEKKAHNVQLVTNVVEDIRNSAHCQNKTKRTIIKTENKMLVQESKGKPIDQQLGYTRTNKV